MLLSTATYTETPSFALEPCAAKVIDVYDADTCTVAVEVFPGRLARFQVRIVGVDTPEMRPKRGSAHRELEKRAAKRGRDTLVEHMLGMPLPVGRITRKRIRTLLGASERVVRLEPRGFDKYGRVLGDIKLHDGMSARVRLLGGGWARPYDGGTRTPWTEEALRNMLDH